ncbi:hypothetical protein [Ilumatobacter sp.]|uniref:hypothetical protein n=1 Tax=Ilumatobacter sp. TaxID=1967498 RepID=UPI003B51773A
MSTERSGGVDRAGVGALAASGVLVAHEVGYLVGDGASVSHAYLGVVGPLVVLATCAAAWCAAVRVLRHDPRRLPSLSTLALLQMSAFVSMEAGERLVAGSVDPSVSGPVVAGLLLQPLVAAIALQLLRVGRSLVEAWRDGRHRIAGSVLPPALAPVSVLVRGQGSGEPRLRGPPR